jgi:SAM-dependent methyltransferase
MQKAERASKREALISLLRGEVSCPLLSALGESGAAERMAAGPFTAAEVFPRAPEPVAEAVLRYLASLGLLTPSAEGDSFSPTRPGRTVLGRWGAFALLHSYEAMFRTLGGMLAGETAAPPVDRARNIAGSGQMHARKYFPAALRRLRVGACGTLLDVGCGDGTWLAFAARELAPAGVVALDVSPVAVEAATARLRAAGVPVLASPAADGCAVEEWAASLPALPEPVVVSLWFVLHEFSGGSTARVLDFFHRLHRALPRAQVLVGELVAHEPETLAAHCAGSILPEYLLFHALSGQRVLTWPQFEEVRRGLPYAVAHEERWDELPLPAGGSAPCSLLWHLIPQP